MTTLRMLLRKMRRDLRASLAQTVALVVIIALGIASYIAVIGAYRDLGASYNRTYDQLNFADVTFAVQAAPGSVAAQIAAIDGVAAVSGRLIIDSGLQLPAGAGGDSGDQIRARLIGVDASRHPPVNDVLVTDGRFVSAGDQRVVLLESHFAEAYGFAPGVEITPFIGGETVALQAVGIAASPEYLVVSASRQDIVPSARTFAVLFMPLAELQALAGAGDTLTSIAVRVAPGADRAALTAAIQGTLAPYGLLSTTLQEDQPSAAALRLDLDGYREIGDMMPALILFAAAASLYVMLSRSIRAQRVQIGLIKALGYNRRFIVASYLGLAAAIGVAGALLGVAAGFALSGLVTTEYAAQLGIPLVQSRFYPDLVVTGVLVSLVTGILAGAAPAWRAAGVAPATAMQPNAAEALVAGRASLIERWLRLPMWLTVPLRNVTRVRSRALSTGLGIVLAFVLMLASWGLMDSMSYMLNNAFEAVERWDLIVLFDGVQSPSITQNVGQIAGVKAAEAFLQIPASVTANGHSEDIFLNAIRPEQTMHALAPQKGRTAGEALAQGRVLLTSGLAGALAVHEGDTVTVDTLFGSRQLIVGGTVEEMMSPVAYMALSSVQAWAGGPEAGVNGVYVTAGSGQAQAVQAALYRLPGAASVQLKSAIQRDWNSLMGFFYLFVGVILAFALAMSFALLFNTMTVNVLEQQRELATMRAIGASRRLIALFMVTESVILWLITLAPGLLLGYLAAQQMGAAFQSDLFTISVTIRPASFILTALGILATMLLALIPALRRVNRLDLAQATKVLT